VQTYQFQLDAIGDLTRRSILERLRQGPLTVGELADELPVTRPAVSQHLRILKQAHLVQSRPAGTRRYYQLDPKGFADLRSYFDNFWTIALEAFKAKIEEK
jgi:DNA-binding transcriptional ArsR family regulator